MESQKNDNGIRYIAALVLKNTLRNHIMTLKSTGGQNELDSVKELLLNNLLTQPSTSAFDKKIRKEMI